LCISGKKVCITESIGYLIRFFYRKGGKNSTKGAVYSLGKKTTKKENILTLEVCLNLDAKIAEKLTSYHHWTASVWHMKITLQIKKKTLFPACYFWPP